MWNIIKCIIPLLAGAEVSKRSIHDFMKNEIAHIDTYSNEDSMRYVQNFVKTIKEIFIEPPKPAEPAFLCHVGLGPNSVDLFEGFLQNYPSVVIYVFENLMPRDYWESIPERFLGRVDFRNIDSFGENGEYCDIITWSLDVKNFSLRRLKPLVESNMEPVIIYNMRGCIEGSDSRKENRHECKLMHDLFEGTICGIVEEDGYSSLQLPNGTVERIHMPHTKNECGDELCTCFTLSSKTALMDTVHIDLCQDPTLNFTSQWAQDAFVLKNFVEFDNPGSDGNYVDIGAFEPFLLSSTAHFDQCFGWRGLCIEPNPNAQTRLQSYRSCEVLPFCVYKDRKTSTFTMTDELAAMVNSKDEGLDTFKADCYPLQDILFDRGLSKSHHNKTIHFLSVDTEGGEIDIFREFPWEFFDIRVIVIEVSRQTATPIDNLILPRGYVKAGHLGKDAVYVEMKHYIRAMEWRVENFGSMWIPGEDNIQNGQQPFKDGKNKDINWINFQRRFGIEEDLDMDVGDHRAEIMCVDEKQTQR